MDDCHNTNDEPQGGNDVLCWRTPDGIGHRFDDDTYFGDEGCDASTSGWETLCGESLKDGVPDLNDPIDCMTCIVLEARYDVP